jgi:hypothetical protein
MMPDQAKVLHAELADATKLVWMMQHHLTDSGGNFTAGLEQLAAMLTERAGVIEGFIARWATSDPNSLRKD